MVSSSLEIHGGKVKAVSRGIFEQVIGDLLRQESIDSPNVVHQQAADVRVHAVPVVHQNVRRVAEALLQLELIDAVVVGVVPRHGRLYHRMTKTVSRSGEGVSDAGVRLRAVVAREVSGQQQLVVAHGLWAEDDWEELRVRDELQHGTHQLPGFLEERLVIKVRVIPRQLANDPVVFAHPDGVHAGESHLLVHALVACQRKRWKYSIA